MREREGESFSFRLVPIFHLYRALVARPPTFHHGKCVPLCASVDDTIAIASLFPIQERDTPCTNFQRFLAKKSRGNKVGFRSYLPSPLPPLSIFASIFSFVASLASIPFILAFFLRVLFRSSYRCFSYSLHSSNFLSPVLHLSSFFSTLSLFTAFEFLYTSPFILFLDASFLYCIRSISHPLYFTFHFHSNY